jgi:NAD(P)-dependent dehydrogenase (short-subunit alcohol dehydrogenase family)
VNVIITGASRGIGAAIARRLAQPGRRILVNYLQNAEAAESVAGEVRARGAEALVVQGDVRSEADLERLARTFDEVDVLVHNAAIGVLKPWDKIRTAQWDLTLESSLRPFWLLTRLCRLREGANVIGISSMGSQQYVPGYAAMGVAKAGIEALTRQLAVELAPRVRVNTVCGGLIRTDALRYFPEQGKQMIELAEKLTPLGRCGEPDDVAGLVDLLLDPRAYWLTGQVLVADGGMSLR